MMMKDEGGSVVPFPGGGNVPIIGRTIVPCTLRSVDLVDERPLRAEGPTRFFCGDRAYGALMKSRDVRGITLLAAADARGRDWVPLVGALVVLRIQLDEMVLLDLATRGDGSTIEVPGRPVMDPGQLTELGQFVHCPLLKGTLFRVEVDAPGKAGARVRAILHGVQADPA